MKKSVCLLLILALYSFRNYAQTGLEGFNYQSIVRDNQGVPLTNKAINFRFSLLDGSANGNAQYVETKLITTNATGLVNHIVGKGTPVQGTFNAVPFQNANQFLKVEADIAGGNNFQTIGTTQLVSVPYAQYAAKASSGINIVKLLPIFNSAILMLNNVILCPNEFHSQAYTAGPGESALIQFSASLNAANSHSTTIFSDLGISKNSGPFSFNPASTEIALPVASGFGGVLSNSVIVPLTAGETYVFSPSFKIGLGAVSYQIRVNGFVMVIRQ